MWTCKILTLTELSPFWTTCDQQALQQTSFHGAIPKPGELIFQGLIPVEVLGLDLMWIASCLTFVSVNNPHCLFAKADQTSRSDGLFQQQRFMGTERSYNDPCLVPYSRADTSPCFCYIAFIALTGNHKTWVNQKDNQIIQNWRHDLTPILSCGIALVRLLVLFHSPKDILP